MAKKDRRRAVAQEQAPYIVQRAEQEIKIAKWDLDPVKQYVRQYGWLNIIRKFDKKRRQKGETAPFKYLTLPGENSSDIGLLIKSRLLGKTTDDKLNVAICDRDHADKVANYLGPLGGLLGYSRKMLHEELREKRGELQKHFPFDVINMDICNCLIPAENNTAVEAIHWILRLQQGRRFLLLLTTKPDPAASHRLSRLIRNNLRNDRDFKESFVANHGENEQDLCNRDYTLFSQIAFPKFIARMAREVGYKTTEYFAAHYTRKDDQSDIEYNMVCHSLEFEPVVENPRFSSIPRNITDENLEDLSANDRERADAAYSEFIRILPTRNPENIVSIVESDRALRTRLDKQAKSLFMWWEKPRRRH